MAPNIHDRNVSRVAPLPLLTALLGLAVVAAYAAGLAGPFVLDDHVNLAPIWNWLSGRLDLASALFDNRSGPTGRPLAYLSFALNAQVGGQATLGFKLFNLALHLAAAWLVLLLLRRVLLHDARFVPWPAAALALAALWALHPMHVSSVLYVVQRMALLGALAQLGAVLAYLHGRSELATRPAHARRWLFVAFPALVALGLLAKETAALAPLLCAVTEFTLFARQPRTRSLRAFLWLFVALPLIAGLAWLIYSGRLGGGYGGREFTLAERLLTQPRVLLDYAANWFWPTQLGLYRDGYPHSTGLLAPPATLLAIALWTTLGGTALALRRRASLFAFGVLWFLAGHALEAGPIALEPYFEHRNYLPSIGLLVAAAAALAPLWQRLPRLVLQALVVTLCLAATLATGVRSARWADIDALLAGEGPPPGEVSRRLQIDRAIRAYERGDAIARERALDVLTRGNGGHRAAAALWHVVFACDLDGRIDPAALDAIAARPAPVLTHGHVSWLWLLVRRAADGRCAGLSRERALALLAAWERGARQPLPSHARAQLPKMRALLDAG